MASLYPGRWNMEHFHKMNIFEMKGGMEAGERMMKQVK
jgi:hypothetical protein